MKKTLLLISMITILLLSTVSASAAVNDDTAEIQSTSCTVAFDKISSTSARAKAMAARPGASSITSTIQLQKKSGSSYVNTSGKSTKTVQSSSISHTKTFSISSSNSYRIKVTIKYTKNGITRSNNYYKVL